MLRLALFVVTMAIRRFGFQSGVGDAVMGKGMLEMFRNLGPAGEVVNDDVCREGCLSGADGPYVDMVCVFHVLLID